MPEFAGITQWLNTKTPVTKKGLNGKIVLIDFWTYSCINCIRTFPQLKTWYDRFHDRGFDIIGIHTPEFYFEKETDNVQGAITRYGIPYPVGLDNDYKTWDLFGSRAWPSYFLADRKGVIRFQHFGEGHDLEIEKEIMTLLAEPSSISPLEKVAPLPRTVDLSKIKTPEIFLGISRLSHIGNSQPITPHVRQTFKEPKRIVKHKFYLIGEWRFEDEFAALESVNGKIIIRYEANKANMVLSAVGDKALEAEVLIDGQPATKRNKGGDILLRDGKAFCRIHYARLYNLTNTDYAEHQLELRFNESGLRAYTITFG